MNDSLFPIKQKGKILILYYEIMGYMLAGLEAFTEKFPEIEVHIFELDHKKITSFEFAAANFFHYKKTDFLDYASFHKKCISIDPQLLVVSGRSDKQYLLIAREYYKKIYTVTIQDTQITNGFNALCQVLLSKYLYRRYFHGYWGCGKYGCAFAYSIGFDKQDIYNYAYTANTNFFAQYKKSFNIETGSRTILFVGRLVPQKNILALVNSFIICNNEQTEKWKLIIVGEGPLKEQLPIRKDIEIHGFSDADTLAKIAQQADVFCLPSINEPWGVVVHEFASMGLALLISNKCGSAFEFLINGYNGYLFDPNDENALKEKLQTIMGMHYTALAQFGKNSLQLAERVSPDLWANTLHAMYQHSISKGFNK